MHDFHPGVWGFNPAWALVVHLATLGLEYLLEYIIYHNYHVPVIEKEHEHLGEEFSFLFQDSVVLCCNYKQLSEISKYFMLR